MAQEELNKTGSAGRFGARYGRKIREDVRKIEERQRSKHKCPQCGKAALRRLSTGVWHCTKCKVKVAGGAFLPQTGLGRISQRAIHGAPMAEVMAELDVVASPEEAKPAPAAAEKKPRRRAKKAPEPGEEARGNAPAEAA